MMEDEASSVVQVRVEVVEVGDDETEEMTGAEPSVVVEFTDTVFPVPFALVALTRKLYKVVPVRPVTVVEAVVEVPSAHSRMYTKNMIIKKY